MQTRHRKGELTLIVQAIGESTREICSMPAGSPVRDVLGPLGMPSDIDPNFKSVLFVSGGIGITPLYPLIQRYHELGVQTTVLMGFRTAKNLILDEEVKEVANNIMIASDDGTLGEKGLALDLIAPAIEKWGKFDHVYIAGPVRMMQYTVSESKRFGIKSTVSLNPLMIDGTGMCGGCRLTVGGKMEFACVDGPEFDGHEIDFDEAIARSSVYRSFEREAHEKVCNLFRGVK